MNNHESIHAVGQSQMEPRTRAQANAKIAVQSSDAKPYDQTASPALMEVRLSEIFTGDMASSDDVEDIRQAVKGRIICVETVLRMLVQANGVEVTATAFKLVRDGSTTLRVVFSEVGSTDQGQSREAIASYLNDLKKKVGDGFLYEP